MPTPKLPDPGKFERLLQAIEAKPFASVMALLFTLAVAALVYVSRH